MSKNILITGGAGFIGTHLTRLAKAAGHSVRLLDNLSPQIHGENAAFAPPEGVEFVLGDVTVRADIERALAGIDTVVHLAAETGTGQSMYEIDRYYRVNVQGTAVLLDILANTKTEVRNIVLASSRSVYGEGAYVCHDCEPSGQRCFPNSRLPADLAAHDWTPKCPRCGAGIAETATREDDKLSPASIYAATKLAQEEMIRIAATSQGLAYAILRFQNVYGEGQSLQNPYTGILSIFSTRLRLGLSLPVFEDGEETRDFVHVEDVANAVLRFVEKPALSGALANVGYGEPTSIMEVATLLAQLMGSETKPHVTAQYRVGDIRHNFADLAALEAATGFRPAISLEEGLGRFCAWVETQPIPQDMLDKANAELKARNLMG
ncbi:NAD-dependent epimerase/dehydratase family protein [Novosphingobium olei]|uniref:NAD-dependent epimerase/dehydratase family protein n=1 Tax=Novosphingobium olei TaxID=2728851 RepID=UPI003091FF88|nr:NAD-dependent epimerase/dehydratase family protein [Novosphingobium olei]